MREDKEVVVWMAPSGPVTSLEVDAVRSVANALIRTLPNERDFRMIKGYLFGLAQETDATIAMMVHQGRNIRSEAGDAPLLASFDVKDDP